MSGATPDCLVPPGKDVAFHTTDGSLAPRQQNDLQQIIPREPLPTKISSPFSVFGTHPRLFPCEERTGLPSVYSGFMLWKMQPFSKWAKLSSSFQMGDSLGERIRECLSLQILFLALGDSLRGGMPSSHWPCPSLQPSSALSRASDVSLVLFESLIGGNFHLT